jgi:hypothetical protein
LKISQAPNTERRILITNLPHGNPREQLRFRPRRGTVPGASKIALLVNPGNPMHRLAIVDEVPLTARNLGVALPIVEATTAEQLDTAFASAAAPSAPMP